MGRLRLALTETSARQIDGSLRQQRTFDSVGGRQRYRRGAHAHLTEAQHATLQFLYYVDLLRSRWILIASLTIGIGLGYGLYTKYLTVKWYRAQAIVTPVAPEASLSMGTGGAGEMVDGLGGGIASILEGGGADTVTLAERYTAIMNSYAFTTDLVSKYHLEHNIVGARSPNAPTVTKWSMHTMIADRFSTEYDYKSGNLTLYFLDPSPVEAQRVLGYYLDSLRDKLRNEEVQAGASAAASLEEEVRKSSDALLQTQLYELMARQIQREKIAEVQSDFAFKVVEPPVVPDNYFSPKARHNATLAASITLRSCALDSRVGFHSPRERAVRSSQSGADSADRLTISRLAPTTARKSILASFAIFAPKADGASRAHRYQFEMPLARQQALAARALRASANAILQGAARCAWPRRRPLDAKRVCIYRIGNIGDTACAIPAMHAIRRAYPPRISRW